MFRSYASRSSGTCNRPNKCDEWFSIHRRVRHATRNRHRSQCPASHRARRASSDDLSCRASRCRGPCRRSERRGSRSSKDAVHASTSSTPLASVPCWTNRSRAAGSHRQARCSPSGTTTCVPCRLENRVARGGQRALADRPCVSTNAYRPSRSRLRPPTVRRTLRQCRRRL